MKERDSRHIAVGFARGSWDLGRTQRLRQWKKWQVSNLLLTAKREYRYHENDVFLIQAAGVGTVVEARKRQSLRDGGAHVRC